MTKKDQPPRPCGLSLGWLKLSVVLNVFGCFLCYRLKHNAFAVFERIVKIVKT